MRTQLQAMGLTRWMFAVGSVFALVLTISVLQSGTAYAETTNSAPDCGLAVPSVDVIDKNNKKFVPVNLLGVTDPDNDPVTITVFSIMQDEPVGKKAPDGMGIGTDTALIRAERDGKGTGRFYHITFEARDGQGASSLCAAFVTVSVKKGNKTAVDEGPLYDSTAP